MNILENIDEYISQHLNMTVQEFKVMFDHSSLDHISGPSDIKVALSNAMKANRVLSKMRAKIKTMQQDKDEIIADRASNIREELYKYKKELTAGCKPLVDKELVLTQHQATADTYNALSDEKKKKAKAPELPTFTTIDATRYTEADITKASETALKELAKTAATNEVRAELKTIMTTKQAVDELLEAVRKEISALGSLATVISSEQYGMNRQGSLERKEQTGRLPKPDTSAQKPEATHNW